MPSSVSAHTLPWAADPSLFYRMGFNFEELHTLALRKELQASTRRLYGARSNVPTNLKPYQVN